jgi:hypothetical protein
MRRRDLITFIGGAAAWPVVVCAQNRNRIPRIAVLWRANLNRQTGINIRLFPESVLLPPICLEANPQKSPRSWPMSRVRGRKKFCEGHSVGTIEICGRHSSRMRISLTSSLKPGDCFAKPVHEVDPPPSEWPATMYRFHPFQTRRAGRASFAWQIWRP